MFAFVVESEPVVIDASADVVWDVLLDSDSYEAWNPFTTRIETDFEPGSPIHMHVVPGPMKDGARNLDRLASRMAHSDYDEPTALAVIVPNGYGTCGPGATGVVPIGALGP